MALKLTATTGLTTELRTKYLNQLKAYARLKTQQTAIEEALKAQRAHIEGLLAESGEESLSVDGFSTTIVAPVTKRLDPQLLITLGVHPDIIKAATVEKPSTPYIKITLPGRDE